MLGVAPGLAAQVERNRRLREAPAQPADRVYTGVLYEALGLATLPPEARARAEQSVVIVSALFGVLRPSDRIPAYRLSMDVEMARMGPLARLWRAVLDPVDDERGGRRADRRLPLGNLRGSLEAFPGDGARVLPCGCCRTPAASEPSSPTWPRGPAERSHGRCS